MKMLLIVYRMKSILWKILLCPCGLHGSRFGPDGTPANYCGHCGHAFNPNALSQWAVTTREGECHEVKAVNEHHARNLVVYGNKKSLPIDATGRVLGEPIVHPDNILSAVQI